MENPAIPAVNGAVPSVEVTLIDADYDRLDVLLDALHSGDAMIVEELDGFLTALSCGAEPVPREEYLPEILGETDEADGREAGEDVPAELFDLIDRHSRQIRAALDEKRFAPVLAHDEHGQVDGVGWAVGFLRGVEMRPEGWASMLEESEFADALDAVESLAATLDDEPPKAHLSRRERNELIDQMMADVVDIHEFFRPFRVAGTTPQAMRVETVRRDQPKIGRNDPCPCGSGKKYKLCCGRN
jgi:uncharacterized protein